MLKAQFSKPPQKNSILKISLSKNTIKKRVAVRIHPFFILSILLFTSFSAPASFQFTDKIKKGYQEMMRLKIGKGDKLFQEALQEDPDNGIAILMVNYAETASLFISEEAAEYQKLKGNESKRLKTLSSLAKDSPYYLFTQAEVQLQWAFVKLKFGEEINALWNVKQAYKLLEQNYKLYPDFVPNKKSLGLLNIVFGSIPDKYISLANLAGMKGDIDTGLELLSQAASSDNEFALEAGLFKVLAENYILKNGSCDLSSAKNLYNRNKDNLLVTFVYASVLMKNAECDEALQVLQSRPQSQEFISFPYIDYVLGEIYLFKSDYKQAENHYHNFINTFKGKNQVKDTYYKLFLCYWLTDEEATAKTYMDKIRQNGQQVNDADKHAQKFAERGEYPNKILMKARLSFDGGYYQNALQVINEFPVNTSQSKKDIVEYNYRKGRILHQMGNYSQAVIYYMKTMELSNGINYYFAPNAALQTGYIYEDQGNKELARAYFNKALSYKDYEYKNSIDNKAKASLNELKGK